MLFTLCIIGGAVLLAFLIFILLWRVRTRHFVPTKNKLLQQENLNADIKPLGFAYSLKGDYFYSLMDCWQRKTGYCRLYDENAALFSMAIDCEPIPFSYAGKRWLIELWKGQYGIATGGEIGVYNTTSEDIKDKKFTGTFYESVRDDERLHFSFILRKNKDVVLKRKGLHWWLTGFRLGMFSETQSLTMDAKIKFPNREMCRAFVSALQKTGYQKGEFSVRYKSVKIHYSKPHSPQPVSQKKPGISLVQTANKNNCKIYRTATLPYSDTLDKLEYLKTALPNIYQLSFHSLHSAKFYDASRWLLDLIYGSSSDVPKPSDVSDAEKQSASPNPSSSIPSDAPPLSEDRPSLSTPSKPQQKEENPERLNHTVSEPQEKEKRPLPSSEPKIQKNEPEHSGHSDLKTQEPEIRPLPSSEPKTQKSKPEHSGHSDPKPQEEKMRPPQHPGKSRNYSLSKTPDRPGTHPSHSDDRNMSSPCCETCCPHCKRPLPGIKPSCLQKSFCPYCCFPLCDEAPSSPHNPGGDETC